MADESEVADAIVDVLAEALYPNGTDQPSAVAIPCKVFPGWPVSADLQKDLGQGLSCISVYPVPSSSSDTGQPFMTTDVVITPAVHGLAAAITDSTITLTGAPGPGEYVTAEIGAQGYSYLAQAGDDAAAVAAGLAAELAVDFPGTTSAGASVTIATPRDFIVRIGAPVTMGTRIHRQRQQFRVVIWSPVPEDRTTVAKFADTVLKRNLVIRLPDTTQAVLTYQGTNPSDLYEQNGVYRRDLMFNALYDTLDEYTAYEITSVGITSAVAPFAPAP